MLLVVVHSVAVDLPVRDSYFTQQLYTSCRFTTKTNWTISSLHCLLSSRKQMQEVFDEAQVEDWVYKRDKSTCTTILLVWLSDVLAAPSSLLVSSILHMPQYNKYISTIVYISWMEFTVSSIIQTHGVLHMLSSYACSLQGHYSNNYTPHLCDNCRS